MEHSDILETIKGEFEELAGDRVVVVLQQVFATTRLEPGKIYAAVRFNSASVNFNQSVMPVTISAFGLPNESDLTLRILTQFVERWNLRQTETQGGGLLTQMYNTPAAVQNFVESGSDFRQLYYIAGTLVVTQSTLFIERLEYRSALTGSSETVNALSVNFSFNATPNTQADYRSEMAKTVNTMATFTLAFSMYLDRSGLITDAMSIVRNAARDPEGAPSVDTEFEISVHFMGVDEPLTVPMRLTSITGGQSIGGVPTANLTFIR